MCGLLLATWPGAIASPVQAQALSEVRAAPVRSVLFVAETAEARGSAPDEQAFRALFAAKSPEPPQQRSAVRRLFDALRPVKSAQQLPMSAQSINETAEKIIVADADPYFSRWQKDATERLNQEKKFTTRGEHQVAKLHPDSFVVVCEAGCRSNVGDVVYIVSKAAAGAAKPPKPEVAILETTAASGSESTANADTFSKPERPIEPAATDGSTDGSKDLPCVAGCYDRPQPRRPSGNHRTELPSQRLAETHSAPARWRPAAALAITAAAAPPAVIAKQPISKVRSTQIGRNGAIVSADAPRLRRADSVKFARAVIARLKTPNSWRATVQRSSAPAAMPPPRLIKASVDRPRHKASEYRASSAQMAKIRRAVARLR